MDAIDIIGLIGLTIGMIGILFLIVKNYTEDAQQDEKLKILDKAQKWYITSKTCLDCCKLYIQELRIAGIDNSNEKAQYYSANERFKISERLCIPLKIHTPNLAIFAAEEFEEIYRAIEPLHKQYLEDERKKYQESIDCISESVTDTVDV